METHAVPHEIMSVEFKLFGNFLSLREFIYIAIGVATAYLFYFLMNKGIVPGIIAFPAIFVFGMGGIMVGLLPIQDKSLDQWIVNYFVAIRRPTQRVWKKKGYMPQTDSGDPVSERDQIIIKNHLVTPPTQPKAATTTDSAALAAPKTDTQTITAERQEQSELARIDQTIGQIEKRPSVQSAPPSATAGINVSPQTAMKTSTTSVSTPVAQTVPPAQIAAKNTKILRKVAFNLLKKDKTPM